MKGSEFRKKRIKIENCYDEINDMIEEKDIKNAKKKVKQILKRLSVLSNIVTGNEIQERSVWNMEQKGENLYNKIIKLI